MHCPAVTIVHLRKSTITFEPTATLILRIVEATNTMHIRNACKYQFVRMSSFLLKKAPPNKKPRKVHVFLGGYLGHFVIPPTKKSQDRGGRGQRLLVLRSVEVHGDAHDADRLVAHARAEGRHRKRLREHKVDALACTQLTHTHKTHTQHTHNTHTHKHSNTRHTHTTHTHTLNTH